MPLRADRSASTLRGAYAQRARSRPLDPERLERLDGSRAPTFDAQPALRADGSARGRAGLGATVARLSPCPRCPGAWRWAGVEAHDTAPLGAAQWSTPRGDQWDITWCFSRYSCSDLAPVWPMTYTLYSGLVIGVVPAGPRDSGCCSSSVCPSWAPGGRLFRSSFVQGPGDGFGWGPGIETQSMISPLWVWVVATICHPSSQTVRAQSRSTSCCLARCSAVNWGGGTCRTEGSGSKGRSPLQSFITLVRRGSDGSG
jgi:hypothetical protein